MVQSPLVLPANEDDHAASSEDPGEAEEQELGLGISSITSLTNIGCGRPTIESTTNMSKYLALALTFLAVPLGVACEQKDTAAQRDAATSASQSAVQKLRADYLNQKHTDLELIDKSIASLDVREKTVAARTKQDIHGAIASVKAARESFAADLRAVEASSATNWDEARARLEKEWTELKTATDSATGSITASVRNPATMTCGEFVALTEVERPKVVYWAEGFNQRGKPSDSIVDVAETDRLVPVLIAECTKDPKATLAKAVQQHASTAPKPAAAAQAPGKMTCKQFVEVDEVVKPKLVYWSAGFDVGVDGGVTDSGVDVEETDKLVPVLVTECRESPKLTFWQKLEKHL